MSRKAEAMRMRGLVEKYHQSQISLSQFAADHGVTRGKLHYWVQRFKSSSVNQDSSEVPTSEKFIPIHMPEGTQAEPSYIIINKPCGTQIKIPL